MTIQEQCKLEFLRYCLNKHRKLKKSNESTKYLKEKHNEYYKYKRLFDSEFREKQIIVSRNWKEKNKERNAEYKKQHAKEHREMYRKTQARYRLKKRREKLEQIKKEWGQG